MTKRIMCLLMALILCIGLMPFGAMAEGSQAQYLDSDGETKTAENAAELTEGGSYNGGWYILTQSVDSSITFTGDTMLIIADGADVTVKGCIGLENGASLTIYAQSVGSSMGKLTAQSTNVGAAIGGCDKSTCGDITINGGDITVNNSDNGAGIGSGYYGSCGNITINGGSITVNNSDSGAGIGTGYHGSCGDITINGGSITINGGSIASAGIGSGYYGSCGDITINDGSITAQGGEKGAGIGSGFQASCGSITINDGYITAQGGEDGAGIGGGFTSSYGVISVNGGTIIAQGGKTGAGIGNGHFSGLGNSNTIIIGNAVILAFRGEGAEQCIGGFGQYKIAVLNEKNPPAFDSGEVGDLRTVNCEFTPGKPETCTESGTREYYLDKRSEGGLYYSSLTFTADTEIGDGAALEAWLTEGGAGFIPACHIWETTDSTHTCTRCGESSLHSFGNDSVCTVCGLNLGDKAARRYCEYKDGVLTLNYAPETLTEITVGKRYGAGWYILKGNTTISKRITFTDDAHLIIADGADVTVKGGIGLDDASLTIYAQSVGSDMGKLTVKNVAEDNAGIGSGYQEGAGYITINGGVLDITGGKNAAGIGTGYRGYCSGITLSGGCIAARGVAGGAGIGTGYYGQLSGGIILNGGCIDAKGGEDGAGIGTGYQGSCTDDITLGGAFVKAVKGANSDAHIGQSSGKAVNVVADNAQYDSGEDENFRTVNCQFFQTGTKEYYLNKLDNVYYSTMPFTEGTKIGGDTELNAWLSSTTASVFSEGNGVIIAVIAAAVVIAAGALVIVKKKKKA